MALERHYSGRELADLLSCSPETIRRAAMRGDLRSVRVGADRRYPESAVETWISRGSAPAERPVGRIVSLDRRVARSG